MLVVGISDMKISKNMSDVITTYSLSSCIGLTLYDPVAQIGGMIHFMLPLSKIDPAKAIENPYMFADTGVMKMLQTLFDSGATRKNIVAKASGGATLLDEGGRFRIGERNYTIARKILWKNSIIIQKEDIGGTSPRNMTLNMSDGKVVVKSHGVEVVL